MRPKRDRVLTVRLTATEQAYLTAQAKLRGESLSDFVRGRAMSEPQVPASQNRVAVQ